MSRSMRSFVTGKTINKQVQLNNRLTTFTNPPMQVGDLYVPRDLYVGGKTHLQDLDICGNLVVTGTIKAQQYFPGQIIYMNMFNYSEISQAYNLTIASGQTNAVVFSKTYTPTNNYSNIIIEYQTICSLPGSTTDTIIFSLNVTDTTLNTITSLRKDYDSTSYYRLDGLIQLNGKYSNSNTTSKTISVTVNSAIGITDDTLYINGNSSTWLKITEVGR